MKIVFLGLAVPYLDNSQNLFSELILEFRAQGHDITLVAPAYKKNTSGLRFENGIQVLRVPTMELFNVGKILKGIANILLPYQYKRAIKKSEINLDFDLVIVPTPPITLIGLAKWFKRKYGSKVYLLLRDIFPQNAVDLKIMGKGGLPYSYFRNQEKKTYRISDSIGCMSEGNVDYVKKHNAEVDHSKFHLLPNWGSMRALESKEDTEKLKEAYKLTGKFVAIYGGNLGIPQKVENIVLLAKECLDIEDIFFLIIGDGKQGDYIEKLVAHENLDNLRLIRDRMDTNEYFKILQIADVGLISLSEDFTIPNIPSKALVYYNSRKPILASVDKNTDFSTILEKSGTGVWAEAGNYKALKNKLLYLYNNRDLCKEMGENGFNYFKENLLTETACKTIIEAANKIQ